MIRLENPQDFAEAKNHIYGLAHSVCLNSIEQHSLLSAVRRVEDTARRENWPNSLTISSMIGVIFDGLAYNNWPWNEIHIKDKKIVYASAIDMGANG